MLFSSLSFKHLFSKYHFGTDSNNQDCMETLDVNKVFEFVEYSKKNC